MKAINLDVGVRDSFFIQSYVFIEKGLDPPFPPPCKHRFLRALAKNTSMFESYLRKIVNFRGRNFQNRFPGSYFGEVGSAQFYWSIVIFTALTLAYVLKGGLRSSLLTDAIQMLLFGLLHRHQRK